MQASLDELVMEMSTQLLGTRAPDLDDAITSALERLCAQVGADRGYVLKTSVEGRSVGDLFTEWWAADTEQRATPITALPIEAQRFWARSLRHGETVCATDVEELARQCPEASAALRADGVRSILFVPLRAAEETVGFIGLEGRHRSIEWDPAAVTRMRTVGELIVGSVERCHADAERTSIAGDLARRNVELERSNRELQQFASVVSHDLSQPLVVMTGFLDVLHRLTEQPEATRSWADVSRFVEAAQRATVRMRLLIDDVLSVARAGAPVTVVEDVHLAEVVDDVLADLDAVVKESGTKISIGSLPSIEGSPTQIRQLLQNLVANALKFPHPDRPPTLSVSSTTVGGHVEIVVADNGVGIPAAQRTQVFEMFARAADPAVPGLGIGLAVCSRVVASHHGTIRIDESPGGGCAVHVRLPRTQPRSD